MYMLKYTLNFITICGILQAHKQKNHKVTLSIYYYTVRGQPLQLLDS